MLLAILQVVEVASSCGQQPQSEGRSLLIDLAYPQAHISILVLAKEPPNDCCVSLACVTPPVLLLLLPHLA
jgi:hypothetical protein